MQCWCKTCVLCESFTFFQYPLPRKNSAVSIYSQ
nr:MAG TPA: hypothetical protein [Bacteriophage sp.]